MTKIKATMTLPISERAFTRMRMVLLQAGAKRRNMVYPRFLAL
jgi:hypothetical protein